MKNLRLFETESQYETTQGGFKYATVSYVTNTDTVHYMTFREKYKSEYLTFEALEDGTFTFTMDAKLPTTCVPNIAYSTDNGKTWTTTDNVDDQEVVVTTPTITAGNKVLWKSNAVQFHSNPDPYPGSKLGYGSFNSSGNYNVEGNIMSLLYGDNFNENNTFKEYVSTGYGAGAFAYLFRNNTKLLSIEYLTLPATTLTNYCYEGMFYGCTSLTTVPELPATTLVTYCYAFMFYGCTSLTTAPELPATTLANYCYNNMFSDCTALTTAPELPATTLASNCYSNMFKGCTALTTAPELPATTLANYCYNDMFYGCSNLNYIKAMFTTTPSTTYTYDWVYGVAATGTFVKNYQATWTTTGANAVPTGWTVDIVASFPKNYDYFTTEAIDDSVFTFSIPSSIPTSSLNYVDYSVDGGQTWVKTNNVNSTAVTVTTPTITAGNSVKWRCAAKTLGASGYRSIFSSSGRYNVSGNVMSLVTCASGFSSTYALRSLFLSSTNLISAANLSLPATTLANYCYEEMFYGCTSLITAPELPATTLAEYCYYFMFNGCTSLTTAPELPATTLAQYCYSNMFNGCAALTTAPVLTATTLATGCYTNMFWGCSSLTTAPVLPATTLTHACYYGMFRGCTSLTTAPVLPATTLTSSCYGYMFYGCTSLTTTPELPVTTLKESCYDNMFSGCTSLTTAPILPATTLAYYCYRSMFSGCTSLTTAPELPATTSASSCYNSMFSGCILLTTAPELPATTLKESCYDSMFSGCTLLTTAPELPAATLASNCYKSMFQGCTSLTTAPVLPAATLVNGCYRNMFDGCTSLTTAPELPATTLATYCYYQMFYGCSSLNYIKAMFTTTPSPTYTSSWVYGVASTGTFVKNSAATWNVTGVNGIPTGWTVEKPIDPFNGYEYIDLGLPSGTKWATMNVGASSETDRGLYFAWGETVGYPPIIDDQGYPVVDADKVFLWDDYSFYHYPGSSNYTDANCFSKYNSVDNIADLELIDDAANVNMGGEWHMPSKEQLEELLANTTQAEVAKNGVNCLVFTSKTNGNTLSFPANGYCNDEDNSIVSKNEYFIVSNKLVTASGEWSSPWFGAYHLHTRMYYNQAEISIDSYHRCAGYTIRGVIGNI